MKQSTSIRAASNPDFEQKAFSDYLDSCNKEYSKLMAAINECAAVDVEDPEDNPGSLPLSDLVQAILDKYGVNADATVTLDEGYVSAGVLANFIAQKVENYCSVNMDDPEAISSSFTQLSGKALELFNSDGQSYSSPVSVSAIEAIDQITNSFHASVTLQAAALASLGENVADRMTIFYDKIRVHFEDVYTDLSCTASYYKELLLDKATSAKQFMQACYQALGLERLAEENDAKVAETSLYQYTGASPVAALDYSTAAKTIGSVGRTIATAVKNLWNVVSEKVGTWVNNKVIIPVARVWTNPMDLKVLNAACNNCGINEWHFEESISQTSSRPKKFQSSYSRINFPLTTAQLDAVGEKVAEYAGKWIKYKFIFGELLLQSNLDTYYYSIFNEGGPLTWNYHGSIVKFKPYCMNPDVVIPLWRSIFGASAQSYRSTDVDPVTSYRYIKQFGLRIMTGPTDAMEDNWTQLFTRMRASDELYLDDPDTIPEGSLMQGFQLAWILLYSTLCQAQCRMNGSTSVATHWDSDPYDMSQGQPGVVNADFVSVASGWNKNAANPVFDIQYVTTNHLPFTDADWQYSQSVSDEFGTGTLLQMALDLLVMQCVDKVINPTSYSFLPYRNGLEDFDDQRYKIATDDDNQAALTNFLGIVAAVVIVIAVAVTATIVIKKISKKLFWKRKQYVESLNAKMWKEPTAENPLANVLTKAERRRYIRYSRRLDASTLLSAAVAQSTKGSFFSGSSVGNDIVPRMSANSMATAQVGTNARISESTVDVTEIQDQVTRINSILI